MSMITYQDFNKILDENNIDIPHAEDGDDVFHKIMEVIVFQNNKINEIEKRAILKSHVGGPR